MFADAIERNDPTVVNPVVQQRSKRAGSSPWPWYHRAVDTKRFLAAEKRRAEAAALPDIPVDAFRDSSQLTANGDQWRF